MYFNVGLCSFELVWLKRQQYIKCSIHLWNVSLQEDIYAGSRCEWDEVNPSCLRKTWWSKRCCESCVQVLLVLYVHCGFNYVCYFIVYMFANARTLRYLFVRASQNMLVDIINGFLKIFRLERINVRDDAVPLWYVNTNRSLMLLSALRPLWFCSLTAEVIRQESIATLLYLVHTELFPSHNAGLSLSHRI